MRLIALCAVTMLACSLYAQENPHIWTGRATNSAGVVIATITMDTTEVPELDDWGRRAGEECVRWYPRINDLLASPNYTPYSRVHLAIKKDMGGVAGTGGANIDISAKYVQGHKDDVGMVIHELTHVIQAYPPNKAGWLVEGIADYIRLMHFEPQAPRPHVNPDKASYRDAYKTTAAFLEWVEKNGDKDIVNKLNRALREGNFSKELFKTHTGKTVDELWKSYTDSLRAKAAQPAS